MNSNEAQHQLAIANNWGSSWFDRDMNALAEARVQHQVSEGGDRR